MADQTKKIPKSALRMRAGVTCKFASSAAGTPAKSPISMLARTGQPIEHWYWGRVVHDMSGMQLHKNVLPIDYCHDQGEVLGYLNKFDTSSGDLVVSGDLVPFDQKDRASEVIFKGNEGVPYEASIDFTGDGIILEELAPNATASVNGYQLTGPAVIVRQWPLRGVAVCLYGADMFTESQFKNDEKEVAVTWLNTAMSTPTTQTKETPQPASTPAEQPKPEATPAPQGEQKPVVDTQQSKPEQPATPANESTRFITAFGDLGARMFCEGKKFDDAALEFIGKQKTRITELEGEVSQLTKQISEIPWGNPPAKFSAAPASDVKLPKGITGGAASVLGAAMLARRETQK